MVDKVFRGEMYYIHETEITGNEQGGGRPGIVVSNDIGNEHSPIVEIVYLTTREKKPLPTHFAVDSIARPSVALCEQIETVHKSRVGNYVGQLNEAEMRNLDKALAVSIGIGLSIKTNKLVEKWAEAFAEEPDHTLADAIKKADIKVPEDLPEPEAEVLTPAKAEYQVMGLPEDYIRLQAERDIYKELYKELLEKRN